MRYKLHNLSIESDIPLNLLLKDESNKNPDILINKDSVAFDLDSPRFQDSWYQVNKDSFIIDIQNIARFKVIAGKWIKIDPYPDVDNNEIALYLLGTILAGALMLRGVLVLHACAVTNDSHTLLLTGDSGAGKSTLAAALVQQGYQLIADDVCYISIENDQARVYPTHPHIKLWQTSLTSFNEPSMNLVPVSRRVDKYHWPVGEHFSTTPKPVNILVEIMPTTADTWSTKELQGANKVECLMRNTYRAEFVNFLTKPGDSMLYWSKVAPKLKIHSISRPKHINISQMTNHIMSLLQERNMV